jgi:hypothetical protein
MDSRRGAVEKASRWRDNQEIFAEEYDQYSGNDSKNGKTK